MNRQIDEKKGKESTGEMQIDILELLYYLRAHLSVLLAAFLAGAVIFGAYTYYMIAPTYEATSKLYMVSASGSSVIDLTDLSLGSSLSSDYEELIKIRPIMEEVIEELDLNYSSGQLSGMISVSTISDSRILAVTVTSTEPLEARNIANALAEKAVTYLPDLMEVPAPNIAEYAITPTTKSSPNMTKNTMQGALIGLVLAIGIYTFRFQMDDTLKNAEDVEKVFGVIPLSVIPEGNIEGKSGMIGKPPRMGIKRKKGKTYAG